MPQKKEKQHEFNHPGPEELVILEQRDLSILDQRNCGSWARTGGPGPEGKLRPGGVAWAQYGSSWLCV